MVVGAKATRGKSFGPPVPQRGEPVSRGRRGADMTSRASSHTEVLEKVGTPNMTWKILVPLDGSEAANRALPWADALAQGLEAAVTVVYVRPQPTVAPLAIGGRPSADTKLRATLEGATRKFHYGTSVALEVLQGDPGTMIAEQAREAYDLVVMASQMQGSLGRLKHPSVAWAVIRDGGTPVLVVPPHTPTTIPRAPRRVLVPLDGSETSMMILSHLASLARALHWMVFLLGIVPRGSRVEQEALATRGYLSLLAEDLHRQLVATRLVVREGEPGPTILELARAANADIIAMSTHSQRGANPLRVGSVMDYVITHATTPILAFHPSAVEFFEAPAVGAPERQFTQRILADLNARESAGPVGRS